MKSVDVFTMWFVVLEVQSSDTLQPPAGWSWSEMLYNFALLAIRYCFRLSCLIKHIAHKTLHLLYLKAKSLMNLHVSVTDWHVFHTNLEYTHSPHALFDILCVPLALEFIYSWRNSVVM
jgi:hypothetical protein